MTKEIKAVICTVAVLLLLMTATYLFIGTMLHDWKLKSVDTVGCVVIVLFFEMPLSLIAGLTYADLP